MCAKLLVLSGENKGASFDVSPQKRITVGTNQQCDLRLQQDSRDNKVATVFSDRSGWFVSVQQGFPWIVDSQIVQSTSPLRLRENSLIRLSPDGPDLRFRLSIVGDVTLDVQRPDNVKQATVPPVPISVANRSEVESSCEPILINTNWQPPIESDPRRTLILIGVSTFLLLALIIIYFLFFQ